MKTSQPKRSMKLLAEFIKVMVTVGYTESGAAQLWAEANLNGSYGLFLAGYKVPTL